MQCKICKNEYPSEYHFKTENICLDCYNKMTPEEQTRIRKDALQMHPMTSTTFTIEGYKIVKHLGVVRGIVVRSRSVLGSIGAALQTIVGGNITLYTELCEKTRSHSFELMAEHAQSIGANAIVGIRYDTTELMQGVSEVLCYGTAVVVEME
jgi:uncharacterized protein YbjQ (UPF0145 family)